MNIEYYENEENIIRNAKSILGLKTPSEFKNKLSDLNLAINENRIQVVIEISIELSRRYIGVRGIKAKDIKNTAIHISECVAFFITLDKIRICKEKIIIDTECFELLYSYNTKKQKELRARCTDKRLPYLQEAPRCKITYNRDEVDAWWAEEKLRQEKNKPLI